MILGTIISQEATVVSLAPQRLCNALIRRSIELRALYLHAAVEVNEPGLRSVLNENAQALEHLIAELQAQIRVLAGLPATRSHWMGTARRRFDTLLRGMPRSDDAWIRVLAREEAALLHAFERALTVESGDMAPTLHRQLPRLNAIHSDMHSLARAVGH
jgi:uncharacterized protein (TIGR02284 family)